VNSIRTLFVAALAVVALSAYAQTQKIAYVETDVILKQLPEAQDADKHLKDIGTKWQDTLLAMQRQLQEKAKQLDGPISDDGKQRIRAEAEQLQQAAMAFQQAKFGDNGEYARRRDSLLTPLKERITKAIDELSKDEKVSFVFDKASSIGILYAEDKYDLTFKVLDRLKRGK
jgi:outer membrane protein